MHMRMVLLSCAAMGLPDVSTFGSSPMLPTTRRSVYIAAAADLLRG
jgi:hypothetical protein